MPKMKTNKSAAKRFKVGGTGRVKHRQTAISHNTGKKSSKFTRQHRSMTTLNDVSKEAVKKLLPYG